MKKFFLFSVLVLSFAGYSQTHPCAKHKQQNTSAFINAKKKQHVSALVSHDQKYDVKFVHLDLNVSDNTKYLSGTARSVVTTTASLLDTFMVLLHQNLIVDSVHINGQLLPFIRHDSMVKVKVNTPFTSGITFTTQIWYKGTPPAGGSAIGSGFSNAQAWNFNQRATWSLSQPFVAYHWWPCKQELTDKIDSSWVFVTTDTSNMAGSNGVLTDVVPLGAKKRFEWKSRSPINYYLISVAVSKYTEYNVYAKPKYLSNDSILVQNFLFSPSINTSFFINAEKPEINRIPEIIEFFSEMYGMYPFYKEKYGHCVVPIGGGMEHQTMTSQGFMHLFWLNVHELAHQWFGNSVTCKSWSDIWINEGFASYSEHLANEYLRPLEFNSHLSAAHGEVMTLPGGSCHFTGADTLRTSRIFDSRLTYDKGGAIIHTLRFVTNNDSLWFNTLRDFQNTYKGGNASVTDFMAMYHTKTGIDPGQFFQQWYYGEGYPTFDVEWMEQSGGIVLRSKQTTSRPTVTPLFITPVEYSIKRANRPDTAVRLLHDEAVEQYTVHVSGSVTAVWIDADNWLINRAIGPVKVESLGVGENKITGGDYNMISLGPNPTSDQIRVYNPLTAKGTISVTDLLGRQIDKCDLQATEEIDLTYCADGVFLVKILDEQGVLRLTKKVVKN